MTSSAATVFRAPSSQPPVRDGVYVAAEQDGAFGVAGCGRPEVAGLVRLDLAVDLVELFAQPLARLRPLVGPGDPAGAVGAAGQVGELLQLLDGAAGVHPFGLHS